MSYIEWYSSHYNEEIIFFIMEERRVLKREDGIMLVVKTEDLIKRYNDCLALDHVSIKIEEGEILGLLGPNGAGKSTFINTITSILPYDSGRIELFGKDIKTHLKEIKKYIGIVPQDLSLYTDISAYENVKFFASLYGFRGKELSEQVRQALEFTGLWNRRKDKSKKFSGGMRRRLNIACAIAHKPKLIIMDEPTVGIDPQSRNHILDSVKILNEMGATIIYTSHYMEEVETLCNRIEIIDKGKVIAHGTKEELKDRISNEKNINIQLSASNYNIVDAVKTISGVKDVFLDKNRLTVITVKKNVDQIIDIVTKNGGSIEGINMKQLSLEDVFLTLTGRSLRD